MVLCFRRLLRRGCGCDLGRGGCGVLCGECGCRVVKPSLSMRPEPSSWDGIYRLSRDRSKFYGCSVKAE